MTGHKAQDEMPTIVLDPNMQTLLRAIFRTPGWSVTTGVTFNGLAMLRLESAPRGRGQQRARYVIAADTHADGFRALAAVLVAMGVTSAPSTEGTS